MEIWNVLVIVVALAVLVAVAFGVALLFRNPELTEAEKWAWLVAFLCFPLVAALVWVFAGPHPFGLRLTRELR